MTRHATSAVGGASETAISTVRAVGCRCVVVEATRATAIASDSDDGSVALVQLLVTHLVVVERTSATASVYRGDGARSLVLVLLESSNATATAHEKRPALVWMEAETASRSLRCLSVGDEWGSEHAA